MNFYVEVTRGYKWPFLSLVVYMLDRWIFFVSCILWARECKEITTISITLTRDIVRQGHAWLQVTFPISGSIHARSMIFFSCIFRVIECNRITSNCVALTRDLVRQSHAWLQVTFPISDSIHAGSIYFFFFLHFLGQGMQRKNNQLRNFDAWHCTSRSRVVTSDLSYLWHYTC